MRALIRKWADSSAQFKQKSVPPPHPAVLPTGARMTTISNEMGNRLTDLTHKRQVVLVL
jgi:hypothetical protein